jgi:phage/plasmid-like protein (TIGR03299 family)
MAHNIGQMFYSGEMPWHELGNYLRQPANLEEALAAGGLDWTVSMAPLALVDEPASAAPQRMAMVRDDVLPGREGRVLGVVHPGFKALQNRDGAQLFDSLLGKGSRVYHTGGYLKMGEVVWLLARLPEDIRLPGDDVLNTYLLFSNSHDGSLPIDIRLTTVRVVCNNTLTLALHGKVDGKVFRRGHNGSYQVVEAEAKAFFAAVLAQQTETAEVMTKLGKAECTDAAFDAFLQRLLPVPSKPATASTNSTVLRAYETRTQTVLATRHAIKGVHLHGTTATAESAAVISPAQKTWWGGLNSVTAWVDHVQKIEGDRYAHIMFGKGDSLKTDAFQRILIEAAVE